jgi:hypothetical protein
MFKEAAFMSVRIVALVAALGLIYSLVAPSTFSLAYAFTANFWVGLIILVSGLCLLAIPTQLLIKKSSLIDHTTYGEKYLTERDNKRLRGYKLIYIGIGNIVITATLQLVAWVI